MHYRKEIDGLRALAVLPVIFFHAGFESFSGGFVGVDVFFVISGYLITTIILTEKQAGTFSFKNFYERRARRILPALFFVMLCCLPFAWAWMFPEELRGFAKSLVAVSIFGSNLFFQQGRGYFSPTTEEMPLLHTWSLAVEEQYYIFFPLFFVLFWRFGKNKLFSFIIIAAIVSLALAEFSSHIERHFYSTPKRVWEILAGAICAFHLFKKSDYKGSQWLSLIGIGLIIYAVIEFDHNTPFPSLYTMVPVSGAALIILFGTQKTLVARILSTPILVGIGLISYSLYLWHQPIFAFARIGSLNDLSQSQFLLLSILSIVLGWITWRLIEQPFRNKEGDKYFISSKKLTTSAIGGTCFFIIIGVVGSINGFENRFNDQILYFLKDTDPSGKNCPNRFRISAGDSISCLYGSTKKIKVAVLGDSMSISLASELAGALDNMGLINFTQPGCPPIRGLHRLDRPMSRRQKCLDVNDAAFDYLKTSSVDTIVLIARWTRYLEVTGKGRRIYTDIVSQTSISNDEKNRYARVATRFKEGLKALLSLGKYVILIYPTPEAEMDVPKYLAKAMLLGENFNGMFSGSYEQYKTVHRQTNKFFDDIKHPNLYRFKPDELFCDNFEKGRCLFQLNGAPLYSDSHHLSAAGAKLVADCIVNVIHN